MKVLVAFMLISLLAMPTTAVDLPCKTCLDSNFFHWGPVAGIVAAVSETRVIVLVDPPVGPSEEILIPCDQTEIPECDEIGINDRVAISGHFGERVPTCDAMDFSHNELVVDLILRCNGGLLCEQLFP